MSSFRTRRGDLMFQTIRQVSKTLNVPAHLVRCLVAQGACPGVYSGNRFLVNVDQLREYLDTASRPENR